jgi:hypothetical protein
MIKDTGLRFLMVLGWTAVLPLVGFSVIGILTLFPLLGLFMGPRIIVFIYASGAAPAFVTAAFFEFVFVKWGMRRSVIASAVLGAVATLGWAAGWGLLATFLQRGNHYLLFALALTGALPAMLMPVTRFAKDRRRWN